MSQQWKNSADGGDDDVQVPLGVGDSPAAEEYNAPRGPRINSSTLVLVGAFATAVVVLYLLGLQNKPRTATAQETQHQLEVNSRIELILNSKAEKEKVGGLMKSSEHLMEMLVKYFNPPSRLPELPRNPFEHESTPVVEIKPNEQPVPEALNTKTTSQGLLAATQVYQGLRLGMVLTGNRPAAMISELGTDQMVTVGARIKMWEITAIEPSSVHLTFVDADGTKTTVELKQNSVPLSNKH